MMDAALPVWYLRFNYPDPSVSALSGATTVEISAFVRMRSESGVKQFNLDYLGSALAKKLIILPVAPFNGMSIKDGIIHGDLKTVVWDVERYLWTARIDSVYFGTSIGEMQCHLDRRGWERIIETDDDPEN